MKKIIQPISILLIITLLSAICIIPYAATIVNGGNYEFTVMDATKVQKYVVGMIDLTDDEKFLYDMVFHHPPAPQGGQLAVKGGRAAGEVVREVVAAELRRIPGRFPKCFRGQQENMAPFIRIGACRKSLFAPLTSFQNFYEVLKT